MYAWVSSVVVDAWFGADVCEQPAAGTDVLAMVTKAEASGKDAYVLNGSKMWITNGCVSDTELGDIFLVYGRTAQG